MPALLVNRECSLTAAAYYQHHCPEQTLFYRWAQRLKRVFQFDISQCGCGGKVKLIASIEAALTVRQAADRMSDLNIVVASISWGQCCHAGLSLEKPGKVNNSDSIHRTSDNKINSLCAKCAIACMGINRSLCAC